MPIAKAEIESRLAQGMTLTKIAEEVGYSLSAVRYWANQYDLRIHQDRRSWTDSDLVTALKDASTIGDVVIALGLAPHAAGNRGTVKKHIKRLSLDVSHLKGQKVGRGGKRTPDDEVFVEHSTYPTSRLRDRLMRVGLKAHVCEWCGLSKWLDEPIPIEVHHINGVSNDHRIFNLRFLCPNCHAMTPTWRGRKNNNLAVSFKR